MNKNRLIKKDPKFGGKKGAIFCEINNNYKQEIIHHYKVMIIITINLIFYHKIISMINLNKENKEHFNFKESRPFVMFIKKAMNQIKHKMRAEIKILMNSSSQIKIIKLIIIIKAIYYQVLQKCQMMIRINNNRKIKYKIQILKIAKVKILTKNIRHMFKAIIQTYTIKTNKIDIN